MSVHRVCMRSRMEEEKTVFSFLLFCFLSSVWDWRYYDLMHWKLSILDISAPRPKGFARQYYASRNDIFWHKILPNTVRLEIQYIWQDIPKYIWVHFYGKSGKSKSRLGGSFRKGGLVHLCPDKGLTVASKCPLASHPFPPVPPCAPPLSALTSDAICHFLLSPDPILRLYLSFPTKIPFCLISSSSIHHSPGLLSSSLPLLLSHLTECPLYPTSRFGKPEMPLSSQNPLFPRVVFHLM